MKIIKRKYFMSLVFDLVLLLVGSGILYQLSLSALNQVSLNALIYVIINSLILGAVLLDIVFEYALYRRALLVASVVAAMTQQDLDEEEYLQ
jgi:uncharacterized membrane protein